MEKWGVILTFCLLQVFSHVFSLFLRELWAQRKFPNPYLPSTFFYPLTKQKKVAFSPLFAPLFSILPKTPPTKHIVKFISQFISLNKL